LSSSWSCSIPYSEESDDSDESSDDCEEEEVDDLYSSAYYCKGSFEEIDDYELSVSYNYS